jgi:sec-independent protein translocase protein TatA
MTPLFAFFNLGPMEIVVILIVGVLLFGRRLPQVGHYLGKSIIEFKRGVKGLEDDLDVNATGLRTEQPASEQIRPPQRVATSAPKFEDTTAITAPPQV